MAGVALPVTPLRRQIAATTPVRPAARRHADDHLGRRRLSPPGARRTGAAALAHARRAGPSVRRDGGSGVDRCRGRHGARPGAGAPRGRRSIAPRAGPGCTRCRPTSTRSWARRPSAPTLLHQRLVGPRGDARARAGPAAGGDHLRRPRRRRWTCGAWSPGRFARGRAESWRGSCCRGRCGVRRAAASPASEGGMRRRMPPSLRSG